MKKETFTPDYIYSDGKNNYLVEEKQLDNDSTTRLLKYSSELRLKELHNRLDSIFDENPDSNLLSEITIYSNAIRKIENNNVLFLNSVNALDDNDKFILSKEQLLSLLLMDNKKDNAKEIDNNFVEIFNSLYTGKSIIGLLNSLHNMELNELLFLRDYANYDYDFGLKVNKNKINLLVDFFSNYKLNDYQKNKIYETLIDSKNYSIDEILNVEEPEIVKYIYDDINSRVDDNKAEIIERYGEKFYENNKPLFTKYVLSKNMDRIMDIIDSDEFKKYDVLSYATVLAKSNIYKIRDILKIPYLKDEWYQKLICPSLFTKNPENIVKNIELCNDFGLENFSNNKTLVIKTKNDELESKINFLNHFEIPLYYENKLHPLFSCDSNDKIKDMTKDICGVEISRNDLKKLFCTKENEYGDKPKTLIRTK